MNELIAEECGVQLIAIEATYNLGNIQICTATFEICAGTCTIPGGSDINHAFALFNEVVKAAQYQPTMQLELQDV